MIWIISFLATWAAATAVIEHVDVMRHLFDDMYWELRKRG